RASSAPATRGIPSTPRRPRSSLPKGSTAQSAIAPSSALLLAFQTQCFNFIGKALCLAVIGGDPFQHLHTLAKLLDFALQFLLPLSGEDRGFRHLAVVLTAP